jgi:hypothetical protein
LPEQLVSDADHLSLSRLVVEIAWRIDMHDGEGRGPAVVGEDTDEFVRTDAGWRFASRTFETLFA